MNLEFRPLRPADFDQCTALMHDRFAYDDQQLAAIGGFWRDILDRGLGVGHAFIAPNERGRVLAFGILCYVDSATAEAIADYKEPFAARTMLERWRAGETPFLLENGIARDNAGAGVNVFVSHVGLPTRLTDAATGAIALNLFEAFVAGVRGLNIRRIVQEIFGLSRELAAGMGVAIRELQSGHTNWRYEPKSLPFLIVKERQPGEPVEVDFLGLSLFGKFEPPRLNLTRPQRDLLQTALIRDNDPWIAENLNVSLSAVKKRCSRFST